LLAISPLPRLWFGCFFILCLPVLASQGLESQAGERLSCIAYLTFELDREKGEFQALDAMILTLRTDNGWLTYQYTGMEEAYNSQCVLAVQKSKEVEEAQAAVRAKEVELEAATGDLQEGA
jgi:hypothetical protein